ncbi:MAG: helix-turn-helix transcriptional regulator [Bacteroidales bacterium]|nr:helix-turn-helix transcriptional regulator [Bacteroidales bacterium]
MSMVITEDENTIRISKTEHQIIRMISDGKTSAQIAEATGLKFATIKWYRMKLKKKFKVETTAQLIRFAIEQNLV